VNRLERELNRIHEREGARVRDLDLLRFELDEIVEAQPDAGEEEQLVTERDRLRHAESLCAAASEALAAVSGDDQVGGAAEAIGSAEAALGAREGVDSALDRLAETARALRVELQELGVELRGYVEGIESEPGRLEHLEERLEELDRLKRKHGGSIESVLAHAEHCRAEIDAIDGAGEVTERLEAEVAEAMRVRTDLAGGLSEVRAKSARRLEGRIAKELDRLGMSGAKLEISLEPHPDGFGPVGQERVTFQVATNPGMPTSPLRDAASGGELSRLMLALAGQGAPGGASTYVFDEIDAGVGGKTAKAVGERLRTPRRGASGPLHHPSAAGRIDGGEPLPDREERRRRTGDSDRRAGRRRRACRGDRPHARRVRGRRRRQTATRESSSRPPRGRVEIGSWRWRSPPPQRSVGPPGWVAARRSWSSGSGLPTSP
jgi:DNA repair protein RecN (Recombination protein N)